MLRLKNPSFKHILHNVQLINFEHVCNCWSYPHETFTNEDVCKTFIQEGRINNDHYVSQNARTGTVKFYCAKSFLFFVD